MEQLGSHLTNFHEILLLFENLHRIFSFHENLTRITGTLHEEPCSFMILKVNQSHYRPEVPGGFQEVKVPRLRDSDPGWL